MFGMAAVPAEELERLRAEAAARRTAAAAPEVPAAPAEDEDLVSFDDGWGSPAGLADTLEADRGAVKDALEQADLPSPGQDEMHQVADPSGGFKKTTAMSAGDLPRPKGGGGKKLLIIGAVVFFVVTGLLAIAGAVLYLLLFSGSADDDPELDSMRRNGATEIVLTLPPTSDPATVTFGDETRRVEAGGATQFVVDNAGLSVGQNRFEVEVEREGVKDIFTCTILVPALVTHDLSPFEAGESHYDLIMEVPKEATVTVLGERVRADPVEEREATDVYRVPIELTDFLANVDTTESNERVHKVYYKVEGKLDGEEVVADGNYFVTLKIPQTLLVLAQPPPRFVTAQRDVAVAGLTSPGAHLSVANETTTVDSDGRFRLGVNVAPGKTHIRVRASRPGATRHAVTLEVERLSPKALRRRVATSRARAKRLMGKREAHSAKQLLDGDLKEGAMVAIRGDLRYVFPADESAVLMVDTCEADECLVAVEARGAVAVTVGQKMFAVGDVGRARPFAVPGRKAAKSIPTLLSQVVYPL